MNAHPLNSDPIVTPRPSYAPTGHGGRLLTLRAIERPAIGRQRRAIGDQAHRDRSIERWGAEAEIARRSAEVWAALDAEPGFREGMARGNADIAAGRVYRYRVDGEHLVRVEPAEYTDPDAGRPLAAMVATVALLLALIVAVVLLCGAVTAGMA